MPKNTTKGFVDKKTERINKFSDALETKIADAQKKLSRSVLRSFTQGLERDGASIKNSTKNKALVSRIDNLYSDFIRKNGQEIIDIITEGVDAVEMVNREYYKGRTTPAKLKAAARIARQEISELLGIGDSGEILKNGYLDNLLNDASVKGKIKNFARRAILTQQNHAKFENGMDEYITGSSKRKGILEQYYKETGFDTIAQADRIVSTVYSNELGLEFAIYEGGIIPTSRKFCRERNGKVFHISEILKFKISEAVPPNYNPVIDLGGYGCRHHLNWISSELAVRLRPDAKKFLKTKK